MANTKQLFKQAQLKYKELEDKKAKDLLKEQEKVWMSDAFMSKLRQKTKEIPGYVEVRKWSIKEISIRLQQMNIKCNKDWASEPSTFRDPSKKRKKISKTEILNNSMESSNVHLAISPNQLSP
jgi:hypothetical protein